MTPREALSTLFACVKACEDGRPFVEEREALAVLEKLVRKDEADKRDVQARAMLGRTRQCTCDPKTGMFDLDCPVHRRPR